MAETNKMKTCDGWMDGLDLHVGYFAVAKIKKSNTNPV
jgi:hypothetical protein